MKQSNRLLAFTAKLLLSPLLDLFANSTKNFPVLACEAFSPFSDSSGNFPAMNKHNKNAKNDDYTMSALTILILLLSAFLLRVEHALRYKFIYFYVACAIKPKVVIRFFFSCSGQRSDYGTTRRQTAMISASNGYNCV